MTGTSNRLLLYPYVQSKVSIGKQLVASVADLALHVRVQSLRCANFCTPSLCKLWSRRFKGSLHSEGLKKV